MNKGYALVGFGLVMLIAFSGCLGNGASAVNDTSNYTSVEPENNTAEISNDTDSQAAGQISSQLMNESDDVDIGDMI